MKEEFDWFLENYEELYRTYGNSFIAIKNNKVIGVYKSYAEAVKDTEKKEEIGSFIVQRCGNDEAAYTNYISSMNFASDAKGA